MRVVIIPPKGDTKVVDTDEKYLLNAGHKLLGEDLFLAYFTVDDTVVVYDDEAGLKGELQGPLYFYGTIMVAQVIDSDENDIIIGDMPDDKINRCLALQ